MLWGLLAAFVVLGAMSARPLTASAATSCPAGWESGNHSYGMGVGSLGCAKVVGNASGNSNSTKGSEETITIPAGVQVVRIGAIGGTPLEDGGCAYPDAVSGEMHVTEGEQLTVIAGGAGGRYTPTKVGAAIPGDGGSGGAGQNNGGQGGAWGPESETAGGGGGGGSFVFGPGGPLLVAGGTGGGGASAYSGGGAGKDGKG